MSPATNLTVTVRLRRRRLAAGIANAARFLPKPLRIRVALATLRLLRADYRIGSGHWRELHLPFSSKVNA